MAQYIDKFDLLAEIEKRKEMCDNHHSDYWKGCYNTFTDILSFINTVEVKDVDLIIHTIIAECCDWLAVNTNLSHDKIEGCRNLMLIVKEEQLKAQKGE